MTSNIFNKYFNEFKEIPSVNQVEANPFFLEKNLRKILDKYDIKLEAYFPLGHGDNASINHPGFKELAKKYNKSTSQIILRFEIEEGFILLPKSTNLEHIKENIDIFDFSLSKEKELIRSLDKGKGSHVPEKEGIGEVLLNAFKIED